MFRRWGIGPALLLALIVLAAPQAQASYNWTFTFQGELRNGGTVVSGTADFVFKLFDAANAGAQVGQTITMNAQPVTNGVFTVDLDFTDNGAITGVFDGNDRWLEITANGVTLSPRRQVRPAPHAVVAAQLALPYSQSTTVAHPFTLNSTAAGAQTRTMYVTNGSPDSGAVAILGEATNAATALNNAGVIGVSHSPNGIGVIGANYSTSGNCTAVYGNVASPFGYAVLGIATSPTGTNKGVYGVSLSPDGWAGGFDGRGYFTGNLGVGDSLPLYPLHVKTTSQNSTMIESSASLYTRFGVKNTTTGGKTWYVGTTGSGALQGAGKFMIGEGGAINLVYLTSQNNGLDQRMGLGTSAPGFQLELSLNSAAKPTSSSWTITSDRRLKKNIRPIDGALDRLMQLHGVTYQWKKPETQGNMRGTYTGMIAQDVEKVFPEWVQTADDGYKRLTVIGFEGLAVEALRDLRAEKDAQIAAQAEEIASLRERLARMESAIAALSTQSPYRAASLTGGK